MSNDELMRRVPYATRVADDLENEATRALNRS
jgi:hypothetical protein